MEYEYTRTLDENLKIYDIGWIEYEEEIENNLCDEINSSISKLPTMTCNGSVCRIVHNEPLSALDKTSQDTVVSSHKSIAPKG